MQKWLIWGFILVFLALTGQDWLSGDDMGDFSQGIYSVSKTPTPLTPISTSTPPRVESLIVTRVVDGDTIVVLINGVSEKVRLIGVDTPETVDPRKAVQCFEKEASMFAEDLLLNNAVRLEADASQDNRDKYGRLLRYVFLENGSTNNMLINKEIISEGYGHEYTYRIPYKYQNDFKNAEQIAREAQKGLWANEACGFNNMK